MDKKSLTERDICTKFISPAIANAGWDIQTQVREEVTFTKGRVIVRGRMHVRGESRRADYVLYHLPVDYRSILTQAFHPNLTRLSTS